MELCACGQPATANGRECVACWRDRVSSVNTAFHPTAGRELGVTANKKWFGRLERFRQTAAEGSVPRGTSTAAIDEARRVSDETGQAFRADYEGRIGRVIE